MSALDTKLAEVTALSRAFLQGIGTARVDIRLGQEPSRFFAKVVEGESFSNVSLASVVRTQFSDPDDLPRTSDGTRFSPQEALDYFFRMHISQLEVMRESSEQFARSYLLGDLRGRKPSGELYPRVAKAITDMNFDPSIRHMGEIRNAILHNPPVHMFFYAENGSGQFYIRINGKPSGYSGPAIEEPVHDYLIPLYATTLTRVQDVVCRALQEEPRILPGEPLKIVVRHPST